MTTTESVERLVYTREEAAAALGIGITKMKELISTGEIRSVKIGRLRRITVSSINEYIQLRELREREAKA
jgi:excisionase family DNA binding protein